jgi:hypothetical protein
MKGWRLDMKSRKNKQYGIEKRKTFDGTKYQVVYLGNDNEIDVPKMNLPKVSSGHSYPVKVHNSNGELSTVMVPVMTYVTKKEHPVVEFETGVASYDTLEEAQDKKLELEV